MKNFFRTFGSDFPASVVVLLIAVPLCLGIALGSNAPLFSGIIAGIVGGIVIGILSGSQLSVSGPAAGLTVIVASGIEQVGSFDSFLTAVVIAGMLQIAFGFLKAGVIGDYIPNSVIKGMLAAIGIILILKQIPHFLGYDSDFEGNLAFKQLDNQNTFTEILRSANQLRPGAMLIGFLSLGILILWEQKFFKSKKLFQLIPGALLTVVIGTFISEAFRYFNSPLAIEPIHLVALPVAGSASEFISFFTFPDFKSIANPDVWIVAFTVAVVASLETMLNIEAIDKLDPYKRATPNNRELKAQGVGNLISGLIGGIPVTSVIVRSSANLTAGGKTKLSAILHGVLMLLLVSLVPFILNKIPLSALAAVLIFVGYKLAKISLFKEYYAKGFDQFVPFVVTILAILFTDLLEGVVIGVMVSLFFLIRSNFRSAVLVVNEEHNYLVKLRKDVSFLNKPLVKAALENLPENAHVVIDISRADFIDQDIVDTINEFLTHSSLKNISVEFEHSRFKKPIHYNFIQQNAQAPDQTDQV